MPFQQIYGFGAYQMKRKNDSKPETKVKHLSRHKTRKQIKILEGKVQFVLFLLLFTTKWHVEKNWVEEKSIPAQHRPHNVADKGMKK